MPMILLAMAQAAQTGTSLAKRVIVAGLILFWASTLLLPAQTVRPFQVQWHKSFGGTNSDYALRIAVAPDGGYLVTAAGGPDALIVRLDSHGNKLWERNLGGTSGEEFWDVKATSDGGWILVGASRSGVSGTKTSPNYGDSDYWIVRMDDQGTTLWDRSFGGNSYDTAVTVLETGDGGFVIAGSSHSDTNEIKTVPPFGSTDIWLLKVSAQGNLLWQKLFGGTDPDWPSTISRWGTNGYVIGATSSSQADGNKETPNYGEQDFWIIAIDHEGNKVWERSYGGDRRDEVVNMREIVDGGFVAYGWTGSGVSDNKTSSLVFPPSYDCWVICLNADGEKLWERTFGHADSDFPQGLLQTLDGGFVITGGSVSFGSWTLRLDQNGNQVWEDKFDFVSNPGFADIQSTPDGGVIAAGSTWSVSQGWDVLVMKLAPDSLTAPQLELLRPTGTPRQLILRGIAGRTYVTERTEDFMSWLPFATNTLSSNSLELLDQTPGSPKRFYRAMMLP
jgi:hypothetical protein